MASPGLNQGLDLDGISPDEAFSILGNEIRLDILRVLWQATVSDGGADSTATMAYSELLRGVDMRDSGKFNYHLSKLTPHFVHETDDGYRLTQAGERITRTVVAVSDGESDGFPCELETGCPLCGGQVIATYSDQHLIVKCTECGGKHGDDAPDGTLSLMGFPASGLTGRTPDEVLQRGLYRCMLDLGYLMHGVCRECAGSITASVSVCDAHEATDGTCPDCDTPYEVWAELRCDQCGFAKRLPVEFFVLSLAPVIGFFYDHDVDLLQPTYAELNTCINSLFTVSTREDPFRIQLTIETDGDELLLTLDRSMTVREVVRRRPNVASP